MDGNRRFAKRLHQQTMTGHSMGFDTMVHALEFCLAVGVPCVTVFAFSLDNFKRTPSEVEGLMQLACDKFTELTERSSMLFIHQVRVRIVGQIDTYVSLMLF